MHKRFVISLTILCLVLAACSISFAVTEIRQTTTGGMIDKKTVVVDAGHGGFDGGATTADGVVEKDINLDIALSLQQYLQAAGFRVVMTRQADEATGEGKVSDIKNRLALTAQYPDAIFVSIHLNKFSSASAHGAQVFYAKNQQQAKVLAETIQASVVSMLQPNNHRIPKASTSSIYLLHHAQIPSVIVECGFISNPTEKEQLRNSDYQSKMAFSILCGILNYYRAGEV